MCVTFSNRNTSVSLLRTRQYGLFWLSSLLSNIGTWMQQVAQPWVILSLSHSSFLVGLDSFVLNAPGWLFTLWGGVLADRLDRKKLILFFQAIQFLCILCLLALFVLGLLKVWMIIAISFLIGTTDSLSMPSFQSIIPSLVSKDEIPRAVALNSTQFNLSRMLGPAIAGVLMAKLGAAACFAANAFSYLPFFISLYFISPKNSASMKRVHQPLQATQWGEFRKLLADPEVRWPLATTFVTGLLCSPIITFCPVLIRDVFHAEVQDFGRALAAIGLGGLIGAGLSLLALPGWLNRGRVATAMGILLGAAVVGIAMNHSISLLMALLACAGMAITVSNISANSYVQENAENRSRGKLVSLCQLSMQGGISAGGLLTGITSSLFGISTALLLNGVLAILLQLAIFLRSSAN
jgi:predicted MFS family arabinose efflux permease